MSAYQTVVVGTDGSDSSLRAVDRAAAIAADHGAKLIVATAHLPVPEEKGRYAIPPGSTHGQDYRTVGEAPFYTILRDARERAHKAGAKNVEEKPIVGAPINALVHLVEEVHADLLVVGNVGLSSIAGRLLGSVPSEVSRRVKTDRLIVHTTGRGIVTTARSPSAYTYSGSEPDLRHHTARPASEVLLSPWCPSELGNY